MRHLPITFVAVVLIAGSFRTACAADMALKAPAAQSAYAWTGFYAGFNAGFGWGRNNADFSGDGPNGAGNDLISRVFDGPLNFNSTTRSQRIDAEGALGGGEFGYNWQFARAWVAGFEADIQASGLAGSFNRLGPVLPISLNSEQKLDWVGTARGRVGYLVNDRVLLFGTAGLAYGQFHANPNFVMSTPNNFGFFGATTLSCVPGPPCLTGQSSNSGVGWTAGAGAEWAATNSATLKFEYLHIALADSTLVMSAIAPATGNATVTANFRNAFDIIRAGVNFHF